MNDKSKFFVRKLLHNLKINATFVKETFIKTFLHYEHLLKEQETKCSFKGD